MRWSKRIYIKPFVFDIACGIALKWCPAFLFEFSEFRKYPYCWPGAMSDYKKDYDAIIHTFHICIGWIWFRLDTAILIKGYDTQSK